MLPPHLQLRPILPPKPSPTITSRSSGGWHHLLPVTRMCRCGSHNWQGPKHEGRAQGKRKTLPLPPLQLTRQNKTAAPKWLDIKPSSRDRNFLPLGPNLGPASTSPSKQQDDTPRFIIQLKPKSALALLKSSTPPFCPGTASPWWAPACIVSSIPAVAAHGLAARATHRLAPVARRPTAARQQSRTSGEKGNSAPATPSPA